MKDINKKKRTSLWLGFALFLVIGFAINFFDKSKLTEDELTTITSLVLKSNLSYFGGRRPLLKLELSNTKKILVINLEELACVKTQEMLDNFKKGDTINIKIYKTDLADFYNTENFEFFQKIYGLEKNARQYIELSCRNSTAFRKNRAGIIASFISSILCFMLALFIYKPKTEKQESKQIKIDPLLIVFFFWLLIAALLR